MGVKGSKKFPYMNTFPLKYYVTWHRISRYCGANANGVAAQKRNIDLSITKTSKQKRHRICHYRTTFVKPKDNGKDE